MPNRPRTPPGNREGAKDTSHGRDGQTCLPGATSDRRHKRYARKRYARGAGKAPRKSEGAEEPLGGDEACAAGHEGKLARAGWKVNPPG
jgi:hypothetical protein